MAKFWKYGEPWRVGYCRWLLDGYGYHVHRNKRDGMTTTTGTVKATGDPVVISGATIVVPESHVQNTEDKQ